MRILISNDDGIYAPGINILAKKMEEIGEVTVVAPDRNCSGASSSLTIQNPLRINQVSENKYSVNGTPADCVNIALNKICKVKPDIVISGINDCVNLSDDVIYSGTIAAALEGRFLKYPAIAVSLDGGKYYEAAALSVIDIVNKIKSKSLLLHKTKVLNVNVPNMTYDAMKGLRVTKLAERVRKENIISATDPLNRDIYWLDGPPVVSNQSDIDTDFYAITNGYVSVTPIISDLTTHNEISEVKSLLN